MNAWIFLFFIYLNFSWEKEFRNHQKSYPISNGKNHANRFCDVTRRIVRHVPIFSPEFIHFLSGRKCDRILIISISVSFEMNIFVVSCKWNRLFMIQILLPLCFIGIKVVKTIGCRLYDIVGLGPMRNFLCKTSTSSLFFQSKKPFRVSWSSETLSLLKFIMEISTFKAIPGSYDSSNVPTVDWVNLTGAILHSCQNLGRGLNFSSWDLKRDAEKFSRGWIF